MQLLSSAEVDLGAGDSFESHHQTLVDADSREELTLSQSAWLGAGGKVRGAGNGGPQAHLGGDQNTRNVKKNVFFSKKYFFNNYFRHPPPQLCKFSTNTSFSSKQTSEHNSYNDNERDRERILSCKGSQP